MPVEHTPDEFRQPPPASQDVCIVCGERMEATQPCAVTKCQHIFHKSCLEKRVTETIECPSCMVLVSLKDVKYIVGNHSPQPKDNPKGQQS